MGIADLCYNCSLHIINSDDINAFCALTENGFAMCLTSALLMQRGINYNILMGYVAHEFAHGALMHHLRSFYAAAKERRKNELLGSIAIGLNVVAAGVDAFASGMNGQYYYDDAAYTIAIEDIESDIKVSTVKYSMKYCREQEIEADLLAYRFLENMGCGEEFINGLRILSAAHYDNMFSEYSDHPTITTRINFLKYVQAHPELGNKENAKLRNKRTKNYIEW